MICRDWRDASAAVVGGLYAAERERWLAQLSWETSTAWEVVEAGRRAGHVPGWIVYDASGRAVGWTFYVLDHGDLQIGGLVAARPAIVRALLDAVLGSAEASLARRLSCFVFPEGLSVQSALRRLRFTTRESVYLSGSLSPSTDLPPSARGIRPWRADDLPAIVPVLAASYANVPGAACFAPGGTREEWARYAARLVGTPACGHFDPASSFVAVDAERGRVCGLVLASRLAPDTVHVAQIAVLPDQRRNGLGRALLARTLDAARHAGALRVTLMVDAANEPARRLYDQLGFTERARFLAGYRRARTRVAA